MVILSLAIVGVFWLVQNGMRLTNLTEHRITALNLAREWVEAVSNIRDTNWLKYTNDTDLCWMTARYSGGCIARLGPLYSTWSYVLFQSFVMPWSPRQLFELHQRSGEILPVDSDHGAHHQWSLLRVGSNISLRNRNILDDPYVIRYDDRALPFQVDATIDGLSEVACAKGRKKNGNIDRTRNCRSKYHRIITLEFATDVKNFWLTECYDYEENVSRCVQVVSMVQWRDGTRRSDEPYEVQIEKLLTNWQVD